MTHVHVIGFGMGPHHLTREAVATLAQVDYVLAARKSSDDALLEVRRQICSEFGIELVEVTDPERDRDHPVDYPATVAAWHAARVERYVEAIATRSGRGAFLVWGDASLYDSTLRVLEGVATRVPLTWDVVPGVSAPQLLASRHRMVLHEIGSPVHVTTARGLTQALAVGQRNVVVMLGSAASLDLVDNALGSWRIWWGANLGDPSEEIATGIVRDVLPDVRRLRERARERAGWVMDTYLVRSPGERPEPRVAS